MRKVIKYSDKEEYIKACITTLCSLRNTNLSDSESAMLLKLITYSTNNSLTLDVNLGRQIREALGIGESLYGTCISRLQDKKCITKEGKSIILNPVYNRIMEWKEVVIRLDSSPEKN